jgi:hypothetical protein
MGRVYLKDILPSGAAMELSKVECACWPEPDLRKSPGVAALSSTCCYCNRCVKRSTPSTRTMGLSWIC